MNRTASGLIGIRVHIFEVRSEDGHAAGYEREDGDAAGQRVERSAGLAPLFAPKLDQVARLGDDLGEADGFSKQLVERPPTQLHCKRRTFRRLRGHAGVAALVQAFEALNKLRALTKS